MSEVATEPVAPVEPVASKKAATGTEYIVLAQDGAGWSPVKTLTARSAAAAIRAVAEKTGAGTYVAVPARSMRPVTVKVETKTQLKLT